MPTAEAAPPVRKPLAAPAAPARPAPAPTRATATVGPGTANRVASGQATPQEVLALQRRGGNAAVVAQITGAAAPPPPLPEAASALPALDPKVRESVAGGLHADAGAYAVKVEAGVQDSVFTQSKELEQARRWLDQHWAPTVDIKRSNDGGGDTQARKVGFPDWVEAWQDKLAAQKGRGHVRIDDKTNPGWSEDSALAQRVVEAFLRSWHKGLTGRPDVPANVAELYARTGASEAKGGNAQAMLLGDPNIYGWCGPATYNAVVLGLLRHGLRFATGKAALTPAEYLRIASGRLEKQSKGKDKDYRIAVRNIVRKASPSLSDEEVESRVERKIASEALMQEVTVQAAHFITNAFAGGWLGRERQVFGRAAYADYELKSGDVITQALMNGSPVSGHVLTVVHEKREGGATVEPGDMVSTLYGVSGNAGSIGGGSVRTEKFIREMPPTTLEADLPKMQRLGNDQTAANATRKPVETDVAKALSKGADGKPVKVAAASVQAGADQAQAERSAAIESEIKALIAAFDGSSPPMSFAEFEAAGRLKPTLDNQEQTRKAQAVKALPKLRELINKIAVLRVELKTHRDHKAVPREAEEAGVPTSPEHPRYGEQIASRKTGRFRPNQKGHMWIQSIIRAADFADGGQVARQMAFNALSTEERMKALGLSADNLLPSLLSAAREHWPALRAALDGAAALRNEDFLKQRGLERLPGTLDVVWPGALSVIEGR